MAQTQATSQIQISGSEMRSHVKNPATYHPMKLLSYTLTASLLALCGITQAHEFWLQPESYVTQPGRAVPVQIKSGEGFEGIEYPWIPSRVVKFGTTSQRDVLNTSSQLPAIQLTPAADGLTTLHYRSKPTELEYDSFKDFTDFLKEDGLQWVEARHHARELPDAGWKEAFIRYAKTLVKVGDGKGRDNPGLMPYEWIAVSNPYTTTSQAYTLQLLSAGTPVANAQVTYFTRNNNDIGEMERSLAITDATGSVQIPAVANTEYLVSSVIMTELQSHSKPWQSNWVSITFKTSDL